MNDTDPYGRLFELSRDAVTEIEIVGGTPIVRAVNPAFVEEFGYERGTILGESLNEFIVPDHQSDEASTFDRRTADGEVNWATVSRQTADGVREFLYRSVPFERDGEQRAMAIYTDITDQRRLERHHQVLHRVLRHNLRNDLTQILAAATSLLDEAENDRVRTQARRIRAAVDDLEELSAAASKVEDMLGADDIESTAIDLASTAAGLASRYRAEYPAATIETDLPETLDVSADHRLGVALDALVENAVEHGSTNPASHGQQDAVEHGSTSSGSDARQNAAEHGSTNPASHGQQDAVEHGTAAGTEGEGANVHIAVDAAGNEGVVTVIDDGPGIPEYERAAVFNERPLSQLSHGSGLGLWLAKWVVEGYGGRLTYQRRGGETVVAAHVPLATETRHPAASRPQD
jgi:PAS domain S-box-containing protein